MSDKKIGKVCSVAPDFAVVAFDKPGVRPVRLAFAGADGKRIESPPDLGDTIEIDTASIEEIDGVRFAKSFAKIEAKAEKTAAAEKIGTAGQTAAAGQKSPGDPGDFTYPYNFVRPAVPMFKKQPAHGYHHRFVPGRHTGELACAMENIAPLFIPASDKTQWQVLKTMEGHTEANPKQHWRKPFFRLPDGKHAVPGSSVRGMIRSVAEASCNACFSVFTDQSFSYRLTKRLPSRVPGMIVMRDGKCQVREMGMARIGMNALEELQIPDQCLADDNNKIEFGMSDLFNRGGPEVVWARKGDRNWPVEYEEKKIEKGKLTSQGNRFFVEGEGIGARLDKEIGRGFRQNAENIRCTVRNLPRFSRKAQWYVYDMGAGPLANKTFEGWIKWADQKELTTKMTHQVFYELKNPKTFDVSDDVAGKYEIAQEGKDNRNPEKLADRQLVFFHTDAGRVVDVGPVQMYKNVYWFGTLEKLKDLGRQVADDENAFVPCDDRQKACPVCRMFGFIPGIKEKSEQGVAGRIFFSDAEAQGDVPEKIDVPLRILAGPKPKYYPFYLTNRENEPRRDFEDRPEGMYSWQSEAAQMSGRKFYWHQSSLPENIDWPAWLSSHENENGEFSTVEQTDQNLTAQVLMPGCRFRFTVRFENLSDEELGLLLFAIDFNSKQRPDAQGQQSETPRQNRQCHRVGMGKPLGMGSVSVQIEEDSLVLVDHRDRYARVENTGAMESKKAKETIENARTAFMKAMESANGATPFFEIRNIQDLSCIADIRNPPQAPGGIRYRPSNLLPEENYAWFGGGSIKRDGWPRNRKYFSPKQPLPDIGQVVEKSGKMKQGQW